MKSSNVKIDNPLFIVLHVDIAGGILDPVLVCKSQERALKAGAELAADEWGEDVFQEDGVLPDHRGCMTWTKGKDWQTRPKNAPIVMVTFCESEA